MAKSSIEWTQQTWNPVTGCTRVSPGCDHCYAVTMTRRLAAMGQEKYAGLMNDGKKHFNGVVRTHADVLDVPLRRKRPTTWFVNSMSDLFHKDVPFEFVSKVFAVMAATPQHTYQILTKRPERMAAFFNEVARKSPSFGHDIPRKVALMTDSELLAEEDERFEGAAYNILMNWPLPNVWLGTSVENQEAADERIPHLLRCPSAVRFLSCEPLLGPVDLTRVRWAKIDIEPGDYRRLGVPAPSEMWSLNNVLDARPADEWNPEKPGIDWVIVGGESGPGARPFDLAWARSIAEQCRAAGVPVFVKQLGAVPVTGDVRDWGRPWREHHPKGVVLALDDKKGGDWGEWPEDLRVREMLTAEVPHA